ncbi:MAG: ribosome assembly RNA-binding protein YhbY [Clostridia bacterium]|nr:ribosome assembly RNA-binding protein YhbY [Clostridia bacterium]MBQ3007905.1 ribosome assembly RNA-binding protein YhbY [Clostridia bacterium]
MMTSKERAALRAQANGLEPLFQIGKGGISDALVEQTADALRKRELIKLKVLLESAPESPREFADKLAEATGSEVVQVVGGSIVFYKENPDKDKDEKKKKPAKKGKPLSRVKAKRAAAAKREAEEKKNKKDFYAKKRAYKAKTAK